MSENQVVKEERTPLTQAEETVARPLIGRPIFAGMVVVAVFFLGFGLWASLAPLDSAAIASGAVRVDTNRKTIKHLEGGIVGRIAVRDGDVVKPGQALIFLDETRPRATLELLHGKRFATAALQARLIAERDGRNEINLPPLLRKNKDKPKVLEAVTGQLNIFNARKQAINTRVQIQRQKIKQLTEEIVGLRGQIRSENTQLKLIKAEAKDIKTLVDKGLARRSRLLALQRQQAEIEGSRSRNQASISRAQQSIGEAKIRISDIKTEQLNDVVIQLREAQSEMFDLAERIPAAEDVLTRTEIKAPLAGTIVDLQVHTPGGVIGPGESLMDIVPSGDRLVVEARVDPNDIDVVHAGLPARVTLTALSTRNALPVDGTVLSVSADRLIDERTGQAYFLARIRLTGDYEKKLAGAELYPGMAAEVMIKTGARTLIDYIFKPLSSSLNRAFRQE
tara:strand:+ start:20539 stop:21888 length:1350 start_codon:yes stop_codon:yes gene_type:complete